MTSGTSPPHYGLIEGLSPIVRKVYMYENPTLRIVCGNKRIHTASRFIEKSVVQVRVGWSGVVILGVNDV